MFVLLPSAYAYVFVKYWRRHKHKPVDHFARAYLLMLISPVFSLAFACA